jgi:hypothetical protein
MSINTLYFNKSWRPGRQTQLEMAEHSMFNELVKAGGARNRARKADMG